MINATLFPRRLAQGVVVAALAVSALLPELAYAAAPPPPPVIPPEIASVAVTDGSVPFLEGHGVGTQNYTCQLVNGVFAFTFVAPAATLFDDKGKQIITHFEGPTGVSWQARDGSTVVGSAVAKGTPIGGESAIPWVRLKASTTLGPDGGDRLFDTTTVQRVNTTGGLAPTSGCDATTLGKEVDVPYTADYFFYHFAD
jgi:hypothetical protein